MWQLLKEEREKEGEREGEIEKEVERDVSVVAAVGIRER